MNTARCVSRSIRRRVREIVECSGGASSRPRPRKPRSASESAVRHAMPRSESMPSKYPISSSRKYVPGVRLGRPTVVGVERRALRFDELVEPVRVEHLIQPLIERMPAGPRQFVRRDPQSRRPCAILASTHRHAGSVVRRIDRVDPLFNEKLRAASTSNCTDGG